MDDDTKLTLHGLQQHFVKLGEAEKNRRVTDIMDSLEFNQVYLRLVACLRSDYHLCEVGRALQGPREDPEGSGLPSHCRARRHEAGGAVKEHIDGDLTLCSIENYTAFKTFKSRILVSTDVFGRGMDIERVNIVVNYDMPADSDTYLHRVRWALFWCECSGWSLQRNILSLYTFPRFVFV